MRRLSVVAAVLAVALLGLVVAGRPGTTAQDATPGAEEHPLVGAWIIDSEEGTTDPPSITIVSADGTAIDAGADGAIAGVWEATGPRTATLAFVGVFAEEGFAGSYYLRGEFAVDAAGETFEGPYSYTAVGADGTVLESGEDAARGTRLRVPAAAAMGTPLAGFPTWVPESPAAATPAP